MVYCHSSKWFLDTFAVRNETPEMAHCINCINENITLSKGLTGVSAACLLCFLLGL
jgi:hypothetical protein